MRPLPAVGIALVLTVAAGMATADEVDPTIVHIECAEPGGPPRPGTGVVISPNGMVLTAKHIVQGASPRRRNDTVCKGSLGHALFSHDTMTFQKASADYDAVILKYPGLINAPHVQYCPVEPRHKRAAVIAAGFPLISATGQPSERLGILATVEPDPNGLLESDAATTSGMSGGRVTLMENGGLVGIVSGASPDDANGFPAVYAILAASLLAPEFGGQFGLTTDPVLCAPRQRVTTPPAPPDGPWVPADGDMKLGMKAGEGFCYLVRVWGDFDNPRASVEIRLDQDQEYVLTGTEAEARNHGAVAQCVRF